MLYNTFENSLFKFMILLLILSLMIVIDCCIILSSVNPKLLVIREEREISTTRPQEIDHSEETSEVSLMSGLT